MARALFELFELICQQLRDREEFVLSDRLIHAELVAELESETKMAAFEAALGSALEFLRTHFQTKDSDLPFTFDLNTGTFTRTDSEFVAFVVNSAGIRSSRRESKDFERAIGRRLRTKLRSETFHNIGWPRNTRRRRAEINAYLEGLGFDCDTLKGRDKDGGLDIVWLPPLGTIPVRPLVSFQCKNARFNSATIKEAHSSAVNAAKSIHRHSVMRAAGVYMCYVVFNDYLGSDISEMAEGLQYAPLGLSDLSRPRAELLEPPMAEL